MNDITAFLNDDARLHDAIEQAEGAVLVELGAPVLATPAAAGFTAGIVVGALFG